MNKTIIFDSDQAMQFEGDKFDLGWVLGTEASLPNGDNTTEKIYVAVEDKFGESGTSVELLEKYGLTAADIVEEVKKVVKKK